MATFSADVLAGVIAHVINDFIERRKINRWIQLLIEIHLSFLLTGSFAMGSTLALHQPYWFSIGTGLMAGAGAAAIRFAVSPLTKNLSIQVPPDLVKQVEGMGDQEVKGGNVARQQ